MEEFLRDRAWDMADPTGPGTGLGTAWDRAGPTGPGTWQVLQGLGQGLGRPGIRQGLQEGQPL